MVKQIMIWKLQDKCFGPNLEGIKCDIKSNLEDLKDKIPGLNDIEVHIDCMSSSNGDVIMIADYEDEEALKMRQNNEHWSATLKNNVIPFVENSTHVEYIF